MEKKMYEVNWHHVNDKFSHCTVTSIRVIREGVLPGCSGVTITAIDHTGRKFQGSPDNYCISEEIAWDKIKQTIAEGIEGHKNHMLQLAEEVATMQRYLVKVGTGDTAAEGA